LTERRDEDHSLADLKTEHARLAAKISELEARSRPTEDAAERVRTPTV
jgi:hypothetical protein